MEKNKRKRNSIFSRDMLNVLKELSKLTSVVCKTRFIKSCVNNEANEGEEMK